MPAKQDTLPRVPAQVPPCPGPYSIEETRGSIFLCDGTNVVIAIVPFGIMLTREQALATARLLAASAELLYAVQAQKRLGTLAEKHGQAEVQLLLAAAEFKAVGE